MNHKFDELTKSMAQSVTRRAALKKFGVGLAGMALACFGLANKAQALGGRPNPFCVPTGGACQKKSGVPCCQGSCHVNGPDGWGICK
jgi:hypothetical protein